MTGEVAESVVEIVLAEVDLQDLYAGVAVIDLATAAVRAAVSGDLETYRPMTGLPELADLRSLA